MKPLLLFCLALLAACDNGSRTAGRTVETTNGFSGVVQLTGKPVARIRVDLFHADNLDSLPIASTYTDSLGRFFFTDLPNGRYRIIAFESELAAQQSYTINSSPNPSPVSLRLEKRRTILIRWKNLILRPGMRLGFPGSNLWTILDSSSLHNQKALLAGIPSGSWSELYLADPDHGYPQSQNLLRHPFVIDSASADTTALIIDSLWLFRWSQPERVFRGDNDGILIPDPDLLNKPQAITLSAWIAPDTGTNMEIASLGNHVGMRIAVTDTTIGVYAFYSYGDSFSWHVLGTQMAYRSGMPLHLALIVDPPNRQFALYMNGKIALNSAPSDSIAYNKGGAAIAIGRHALSGNYGYRGRIAEIIWWSSPLNGQRIAAEASMPPQNFP